MACEKYEKLLQAFFDQSLSKGEQKELKSHLDSCSDCRIDFIYFKNVFQGLDELQDEELSMDVASSIKSLIDKEPAHRPVSSIQRIVQPVSTGFGFKWALAAAAVILIALSVLVPMNSQPQLPVPTVIASLDTDSVSSEPLKVGEVKGVANNLVKLLVDGKSVALLKGGTDTWTTVNEEADLSTGDRIKTDTATRALLFYRDCGRLKVLPDTEIQIISSGIRIKKGSTWIKIFKEGTNFAAHTPNAVASVRGTVYTVEYSEDALSTRVNLFSSHKPEGGVEVTTDLGSQLLPQGTFVDVTIDEITAPAPIALETYLAFNQLPPEEVVNTHDATPSADVTVPTPVDSDTDVTTTDLPLTSRDENFFEGIRER
jgi:hypothetical protein